MRRIPVRLIVVVAIGCGVAIAAIVFRSFFVWFVRVPTGVMTNTILVGDHLVVGRSFGEIDRGSVMVFWYPGDSERYVGRIIGLPGETIELRGRSVYINGQELPEQRVIAADNDSLYGKPLEEMSVEGTGAYRVYYTRSEPLEEKDYDGKTLAVGSPFRIAEGNYFLMGDNRDNSYDSRHRGEVPRELIWGKVTIVYWSAFKDREFEEHIRWDRIFTRIR